MLLAAAMLPMGVKAQGTDMVLPYFEDFESYTAGGSSLPTNWTRVEGLPSGTAVYPNITNHAANAQHGNVLNFNGFSTTTTGTMRVAAPRIAVPLNALEIYFDYLKNGLKVYLATDYNDTNTYVLVKSLPTGSYTNYAEVEIRTDTVVGAPTGAGYVVFAGAIGPSGSYCNAYLDNLRIVTMNACPRPDFVNVESIEPYQVTLSWTPVAGATNYRVSYGVQNDIATAQSVDVTGTTVTVDMLEAGTQYYVWVQTLCDTESVSDARTISFTTQLSCYSPRNLRQVGSNHDAAAFQWEYETLGIDADGLSTVLHDLTDSTIDDVVEMSMGATYHIFTNLDYTHSYEATFTTYCGSDSAEAVTMPLVFRNCGESELPDDSLQRSNEIPLSPFYNYSYSQMLYPAEVLYDMDTIRGLALRRNREDGGITLTRTVSVWMGNTASTALAAPVSVTGMTQVANNVSFAIANQEWDTLLFTTPFVYDGTSNVVLTIDDNTGTHVSSGISPWWRCHDAEWQMHYKLDDSTNPDPTAPTFSVQHKMQLPDIRFVGLCHEESFCDAPVLAVTDCDSAQVMLDWAGGGIDPWRIEYRTLGGTWTLAAIVNEAPYTITGLNPDTRYEVRIGIDCDGQLRYSNAVTFITMCAIQHIPYHFTQSDIVAAVDPGYTPCWSFSSHIMRGRLTFSHRGYLRNAGNGEWIMLPAVAEHLSGARLRTWAGCSSASLVRVGVASSPDCSDVEWVDTLEIEGINPDVTTQEYIAYFDNYTGDGNRIVLNPIVDNDYSYVYFFDFHIEPVEGCRPVVGITLDSADAGSLSFHWRPVGTSTSWLVYVDGVQVGETTTPNYTVTGLDPYTNYEISIRTFCGDGDTSYAVSAVMLTGCEGESCTFTVNAASSTGNGWNGGFMEILSGTRLIGRVVMNNGSETSRTFMVCDSMSLTFRWYTGNADEVCSFSIVNENGTVVYSSASASYLDGTFLAIDTICGAPADTTGGGEEPPHPEGVGHVDADAVVALFPNPASGIVTVTGLEKGAEVSLIDLSGRENGRWVVKETKLVIDLKGMPRGAYYVRVVSESASVVRKLIIK